MVTSTPVPFVSHASERYSSVYSAIQTIQSYSLGVVSHPSVSQESFSKAIANDELCNSDRLQGWITTGCDSSDLVGIVLFYLIRIARASTTYRYAFGFRPRSLRRWLNMKRKNLLTVSAEYWKLLNTRKRWVFVCWSTLSTLGSIRQFRNLESLSWGSTIGEHMLSTWLIKPIWKWVVLHGHIY